MFRSMSIAAMLLGIGAALAAAAPVPTTVTVRVIAGHTATANFGLHRLELP